MFKIGLTGSMGTGKSTVAKMFVARGIPLWDADAAVHEIYRTSGALKADMVRAFGTGVIVGDSIDRSVLSIIIQSSSEPAKVIALIDSLVHPVVRAHRFEFEQEQEKLGTNLGLIDIPLLYETQAEKLLDKVVVTSCPYTLQRQRVLARHGMTEEKFRVMSGRQMPDDDKRQRADYVIDTRHDLFFTEQYVSLIIRNIEQNYLL